MKAEPPRRVRKLVERDAHGAIVAIVEEEEPPRPAAMARRAPDPIGDLVTVARKYRRGMERLAEQLARLEREVPPPPPPASVEPEDRVASIMRMHRGKWRG